ncbi:hypothetical protein C1645_827159 [Glomus cerebriforme]|uniref:HNH nuclease domain-containing protein n=1 Tax=Glomus cerebriforme TaxID=658196 RepID=A0A397SV10_9GLOM|nr:hypothetical protein C1645_827159 [Glomus cerebriforme]
MKRLFGFRISLALHLKFQEVAFQNAVVENKIPLVAGVGFNKWCNHPRFIANGLRKIVREGYLAHRSVALAFCPKEEGKKYVNHIDDNPTNNNASNLEWYTQKENMQHAVCFGLHNFKDSNKHQRPIRQIFDDGSTLEFPSIAEAQRTTGINQSTISVVCRAHVGGYR